MPAAARGGAGSISICRCASRAIRCTGMLTAVPAPREGAISSFDRCSPCPSCRAASSRRTSTPTATRAPLPRRVKSGAASSGVAGVTPVPDRRGRWRRARRVACLPTGSWARARRPRACRVAPEPHLLREHQTSASASHSTSPPSTPPSPPSPGVALGHADRLLRLRTLYMSDDARDLVAIVGELRWGYECAVWLRVSAIERADPG